jgi:hypothetical protein
MLVFWVVMPMKLQADTIVSEEHTNSIFSTEYETLASTYKSTWRYYYPQDQDQHLHRHEILKSHTTLLHSKIKWLTLFKEMVAVYFEDHTEPRNTLCGQNAEFLNVKAGGTSFKGLVQSCNEEKQG